MKGRTKLPSYVVERYLNGKINIDDFITHDMPLKFNESFELLHRGENIRTGASLLKAA